MNNRAVLYLRLSKEDQDKLAEGDDSASIKNQRLLLVEYANKHNMTITNIYSDDDESGLYDDRPAFNRMMEDAKLGEFDVILAKTQARFTRNMEHVEKYLHHDLPILGIRFIGVSDGVDTADDNNKKTRQINGLVNEWYCEDLSKNVRSAFHAKKRAGQYVSSSCPYGYIKDPLNHNHLIIDEYAANVVKDIYSLYLQGIGKARIGRILGERGILIPTLYKREVQGMRFNNPNALETTKVWSLQTIHQILNNEVYIGNLIQNRRSTLSYKDKKTKALPPEKWIKVENAHEPIISKDIFERVKALQKIKTKSVNAKNPKYESIFSGLIFCADCKHSMVRKYKRRGNREFVGYVCSTYKTHGNSVCTSHSVDYEELTDAVLLYIQREARKILSGEDVEELKKISCRNRRIENIEKEIEFAEKRKEKINNFKQKTYQSYIEELISKEDYVKYSANYDKELKELNGEIAELEKHREDDKELELEYQEWVNKFSEYVNIDKLTRGIVLELIERIDVSEDGCICIHYRFKNPYEE